VCIFLISSRHSSCHRGPRGINHGREEEEEEGEGEGLICAGGGLDLFKKMQIRIVFRGGGIAEVVHRSRAHIKL